MGISPLAASARQCRPGGGGRTPALSAGIGARVAVFTGIVETTSSILNVKEAEGWRACTISVPRGWRLQEGDSVSVEGVCSTVQKAGRRSFRVIYMQETLRKTTLGKLAVGNRVNLERSLTLQSPLGGHLVLGHVDTTARIARVRNDGDAKLYEFQIAPHFSRYIVSKGSIAVDGISLTVVRSRPGRFTTSLLSYTLARTTLGGKRAGGAVNIEIDLLAKYLERLMRR
jgi:riboflavin synthase